MALIPDLTGVTLSNTSTSDHVVSFSISAGIKGAPAPVAPVVPPTVTTTGGTAS